MPATKVTLRKRELPSGKITLYLDYYPPIRNPRTMEMSRREYLGIYLAKNPRTPADRTINAEKIRQAEAIRAQRELSLINEQFGFIDKTKQKMDFLAYFKDKLPNQDQKWEKIYKHFSNFVNGKCTFADVTIDLQRFSQLSFERQSVKTRKPQTFTKFGSGLLVNLSGIARNRP